MSSLLSTSVFRIPLTGRVAWLRYFVALLAVGFAMLARLGLEHYWGDQFSPFAFFYVAVMISAWYGGLWPGLLTMAAAVLISIYYAPIAGRFDIHRSTDLVRLGLFLFNATLICLLIENLHRSLIRHNLTARELIGSQKRIRSILESVQGCFFSLDPKENFLHINKDCEKYLHGDYRRFVGKPLWEAFPGWRGTAFEAKLAEAQKRGQAIEFEFYDPQNDLWLEVHIAPALETGASVHFYDISSRKRAEQDLMESEERFRKIADQAPVMIWTTDEHGARNYVNQPWLNFRGRKAEEELGRGWEEGVHPLDLATTRKIFGDAFAERRSFRKEYRWKRHDGVYRWMVSSGTPRFDSHGKFIGYVGSAMDITETRQTLKERESFLRRHNEILISLAKKQQFADFKGRVREIAEAAAGGLEVGRSSIWFFGSDRAKLHCLDLFERPSGLHRQISDLDVAKYPVYFESLERYRTIAADNAAEDPRTQEFDETYLKPAGIVSMLDAPIRHHGRTIGVLCNEATAEPRVWTLEEQAFAASLADMLALAVEERDRSAAEEALKESEQRLRRDLEDRKLRERRQATEYAVTQLLSSDPLLSAAIPRILATICEGLGWDLGVFWEIPDGRSLQSSEVWARDPGRFPDFIQTTLKTHLGIGEGLPGRAWMSGRSLWFEDLAAEDCSRKSEALAEGLKSAVAFPVHFGEELLGIFEFYSTARQASDDRKLEMFEVIGSEIGQFIERKRAEEELRLSQQHLSLAMQSARMGYWSWDLKSNRLITSENLEFFHGKKEEVFGGNLKDFIACVHPDDREMVWKTFERAMLERSDYYLEFRSVWPDGSVHWINARGQIFYDEDREPDQMIGLGIDITERKQAEAELEAANTLLEKRVELRTAELARANQSLQAEIRERQNVEREALEIVQKEQMRFSAQLHDGLCQSLAGTMMLAKASVQKLEKQKVGEVDELKNVIELINQSVGEARDLARGLFPVELEANSLMLSLKSLTARIEQLFGVTCEFDCPVPILVGDNMIATHLYRIAQEAINNAIHHGKAKRMKLSLLERENRLLLQLIDDGIGISQDFNFSAGIGLHIMKYRARMMDGELRFETRAEGTVFSCEVPMPPESFVKAQ